MSNHFMRMSQPPREDRSTSALIRSYQHSKLRVIDCEDINWPALRDSWERTVRLYEEALKARGVKCEDL